MQGVVSNGLFKPTIPTLPLFSNRHAETEESTTSHHAEADSGENYSPRKVKKPVRVIGNYILERTIGRGQFGKVKLAYHKKIPDLKVAIKVINKSKLDADSLRMIQREVRIIKLVNHPHIIRIYEVMETPKMIFLVMEYAECGEVMDYIIAHGCIPERESRRFFAQMLSAVQFCHSKRVVHRDLKPENLLFDTNVNIKIIDFGLSNQYGEEGSLMKTFCGSPTYASPELILRKEYFGPAVDVWSMGVILFVLVCGYLPFDGNNFSELFHKILNGIYTIPEHVSPDCASLIKRMLVVDPDKRATTKEIRSHPWLEGVQVPAPPAASDITDISKIDQEVIQEMVALGFNSAQVIASLLDYKFDDAAATYFLLELQKHKRTSSKGAPKSPELQARRTPAEPAPQSTPDTPGSFKRGHKRNHTADSQPNTPVVTRAPSSSALVTRPALSPTESPLSSPRRPSHTYPTPNPTLVKTPTPNSSSPIDSPRRGSASGKSSPSDSPRRGSTNRTPGSQDGKSSSIFNRRRSAHRRAQSEVLKPEVVDYAKALNALVNNRMVSTPTPAQHAKPETMSVGRTRKASDAARRIGPTTPRSTSEFSVMGGDDDWVMMADPEDSDSTVTDDNNSPRRTTLGKTAMSNLMTSFRSMLRRNSRTTELEPLPRSVRFAFTLNTTSEKSAESLMAEARKALANYSISSEPQGPFLLDCTTADLQFTIEVCRIARLSLHGVKLSRISGNIWKYKTVCKEIISHMKL